MNLNDRPGGLRYIRTFCPRAAEYMFFSSAYGSLSRTEHMLGHKRGLINLRRLKLH